MPLAPEFDTSKVDEIDEADSKKRAEVSRAIQTAQKQYRSFAIESLQGKKDYRSNSAAFDKWFVGYVIPQLTLDSPDKLRKLASNRIELIDDYITRPAKVSGNAQFKRAAAEHLVRDLLFPAFSKIVTDTDANSYRKEVKINAMLAIGELNLSEGSKNAAPVPLADALPFMVSILKSDRAPDYLKAPALAGVERQALIDAQQPITNDANRAQIKAVCLALLGDKPEGRSDDLQYWMQRRAAVILGAYGDPGADKSIANALVSTISTKENRLWLRCEAAKAIGNMKFNPADAAALKGPATEVGKLAMNALRKEASFLRGEIIFLAEMELKRDATKASPSSGGGGGGGRRGGADEDDMAAAMALIAQQEDSAMGGDERTMESGPMEMFPGGLEEEEDAKGAPKISEFGNREDPEKELPGYKINISRRRLKTVAMYLESAVGQKDNQGLAKFLAAGDGQALLMSLRSAITDVQETAHMGVDDRYEALTLDMIDTMIANSEKIANSLGVVDEVDSEDAAVEEMAKKAEEAIDKGVVKAAAEGTAAGPAKAGEPALPGEATKPADATAPADATKAAPTKPAPAKASAVKEANTDDPFSE